MLFTTFAVLVASANSLVLPKALDSHPPLVQSALQDLETLYDIYENGSAEAQKELAHLIAESPMAAIAPTLNGSAIVSEVQVVEGETPFVLAHGMGDSCFNPGMKSITSVLGKHRNVYSTCVPTGSNWLTDTIDGFLKNMDSSIDTFAKKIQADPKLANGFNCVGFSQGNSLCRGYIEKYNNPVVKNFLSVHGTVSGVAGFPQCNPAGGLLGPVCRIIAGLCGDLAYNSLVQGILFQADYFRRPGTLSDSYKAHSQLAQLNNEGDKQTDSYKSNFGKTSQYVMVKAKGDTMVFPNDGEWWGYFDDTSYKTKSAMKDTTWYTQDLFGLGTADKAGKIHFESTEGNHLQFTEEQLLGWVDKYNL